MEEVAEEAQQPQRQGGRHIKKRALRNKALSVAFNEKDLKDYVGGFHKRKKKRRKEAEKQLEEVARRKRIEQRKKRKLEKEFAMYGGAVPTTGSAPDECDEEGEEDEGTDITASIAGTATYDNGGVQVTVTTSEISREEENHSGEKMQAAVPRSFGADKKHNVPVTKKKSFKKVAKHRSKSKPQNKRDKRKGKKRNKNT